MKIIPKIIIINLKDNLKINLFHTHNQVKWEFNYFISLGLTKSFLKLSS